MRVVVMDRNSNPFIEPDRGGNILGWALKQLVMWSVIGFVVYAAVANRQLFRQSSTGAPTAASAPSTATAVARGSAMPAAPAAAEHLRPLGQATLVVNSLTLRAQANGHVLLTAEINGAPIKFLVDTGATWVSLTHEDAVRAGVAGNLTYSMPMQTANGTSKAAPVTLHQVRIGQLMVPEVSATVMSEETGISLLGQSFLKRLRSYEMRGDVLTLTWQ